MKKAAISVFALILLVLTTFKVSAQSEETRQVSDFDVLASAGPFNVHVNINGTESLRISADADVIKDIETNVSNNKLEIKFKNHSNWNHSHIGKVEVYVTAKSLKGLVNSGSGSINVEGVVSGGDVSVVLSGSGSVSSSVKSGKLNAVLSGSGSINLNGSAGDASIVLSGSGSVNGKELKAGDVSVVLSGSGNTYINADKSVSAQIVGSGNVVYSGNATISNSKTVGSGRVRKAD